MRWFIKGLLDEEWVAALGRGRYERAAGAFCTHNGRRDRQLLGTFGPVSVSGPRARITGAAGRHGEWRSKVFARLQALDQAGRSPDRRAYLSGTNTCRVRRAPAALFDGAVGKDTVSRVWHKHRSNWEAWQQRDLSGEDIVRLILDGTVVRVRLDRKATSPSVLVALGVRRDAQKVLPALRNMGAEGEAAWRAVLDELVARGLGVPELAIVDGAPGLERALVALWGEVPLQRCTVHMHRNLLAHAPKKLAEEIGADYTDMIYAKTAKEVVGRGKALLRKWRLRCKPVADSLEEAGEKLFTFLRFPAEQWRSIRTTNAIECLHEEFKRRIKTQCLVPCAETACMLLWALLASGQIALRKVDGWQTLRVEPAEQQVGRAA